MSLYTTVVVNTLLVYCSVLYLIIILLATIILNNELGHSSSYPVEEIGPPFPYDIQGQLNSTPLAPPPPHPPPPPPPPPLPLR